MTRLSSTKRTSKIGLVEFDFGTCDGRGGFRSVGTEKGFGFMVEAEVVTGIEPFRLAVGDLLLPLRLSAVGSSILWALM